MSIAHSADAGDPDRGETGDQSAVVRTVGAMFIAGFAATLTFDLWGQILSPGLGFANLSPHGLAKSLLATLNLPSSDFAGYFVHFYLVGLIGYPVGWLFVFRPLWTRASFARMPWIVPAALYGFGLWVFAIGGVTAVAGLPFFLNFTGIAWVALIGHVLYGVVLVFVLRKIHPAPIAITHQASMNGEAR